MDISLFDFHLPKELIAKYPLKVRHEAKMMVLDRKNKTIKHSTFWDLDNFLEEGDLLVFNDTKVIPARFYGKKKTGGEVEIVLTHKVRDFLWEALIGGKHIREGILIDIGKDFTIKLLKHIKESLFLVELITKNEKEAIEKYGKIPIPPYLERDEEPIDREYYQTVFAKKEGSVASPTASLHFSEDLLEKLKNKGVEFGFLTLHVSYGTFKPVKSKNIEEHYVDKEYIIVPKELEQKIQKAKGNKKRVIAVGTTVTRALETSKGKEYRGFTDLYIKPGFKFNVLDGLITNFHLPKSSLLILVSAFVGREFLLGAYEEAIRQKYRFYSYGDGMLIL